MLILLAEKLSSSASIVCLHFSCSIPGKGFKVLNSGDTFRTGGCDMLRATMHSGSNLSSQHCCLPTVQSDSPQSEHPSRMQVSS